MGSIKKKSITKALIATALLLVVIVVVIILSIFKQQQFGEVNLDDVPEIISEESIDMEVETETDAGKIELYSSFIAIHLEPDKIPTIRELWPKLEELVALADEYSIKFTLLFTEPWASYALKSEERLAQVRGWEANGHELGMHHHSTSHLHWDGYSNSSEAQSMEGYKGTMEDLMKILNQLPASGQMVTGGTMDEEWADGLIYSTTNAKTAESGYENKEGAPTPDDMISEPNQGVTYGEYSVVELGKMGYAIDHLEIQITLEDVKSAILAAEKGEILGLVLNDNTMKEHGDQVVELFEMLKALGVEVKTVADILGDYS